MSQGQGTLVELFDNAVDKYRDKTAFVSRDGIKTSYRELGANALKVTGSLQRAGIKKRDLVALVMDNTDPSWPAAHHGILHAGGVSVLLSPNLKPESDMGKRLGFTEPRLVLCKREDLAKVQAQTPNGVRVECVDKALEDNRLGKTVVVNQGDDAVHMFSSGTTGVKDIVLTHGNLSSNVYATEGIIPLSRYTRYAEGLLDSTHSFANMIHLASLNLGAESHYTSFHNFLMGLGKEIGSECFLINPWGADGLKDKIAREFKKTPQFQEFTKSETAEKLKRRGILKNPEDLLEEATAASARVYIALQEWKIPSLKDVILHRIASKRVYPRIRKGLEDRFGSNMKFILGGSAALSSATQNFFRAIGKSRAQGESDFTINQGYGTTETAPVVAVNTPDAYLLDARNLGVAPSGRVIPGVRVLIADRNALYEDRQVREVQEGETGTILVNGPNVFSRYYLDDKRTADAFIRDESGTKWFVTRDRGLTRKARKDKHGRGPYLTVLGRDERLIVFPGGRKDSPEGIEAAYSTRLGDIATKLLIVGSQTKTEPSFVAIAIAGEKLREDIQAGKRKREEVEAEMSLRMKDCKVRFGLPITGAYLDTEADSARLTTSLGKLKFREYLRQLQARGVLKEIRALDNTTRYS